MKTSLNDMKDLLKKEQDLLDAIVKNKYRSRSKKMTAHIEKILQHHRSFDEKLINLQHEKASHVNHLNVLLVEDQPFAARVASDMLSQHGCKVTLAHNGKEALQQIEKKAYDIVFLDIGLPDMDGFNVAKTLRDFEKKQTKPLHIIALTAYLEQEVSDQCLKAGIDHVVVKPLCEDRIIELTRLIMPLWKPHRPCQEPSQEPFMIAPRKRSEKWFSDFIMSFQKKEQYFSEAFSKKDWSLIQFMAHGLKGSATYCGMMRLKEACAQLESTITQKGKTPKIKVRYHQLIEEMQTIEKLYACGYIGITRF